MKSIPSIHFFKFHCLFRLHSCFFLYSSVIWLHALLNSIQLGLHDIRCVHAERFLSMENLYTSNKYSVMPAIHTATISISQNNSFRKLEYVCALYHCGTGNDNCMSAIEKKWQNHIVNDVGFTSDARHNSSLFFVQARRNRCERPKYFFFTFSSGIVITECEMRYVSICVVCRQPDL